MPEFFGSAKALPFRKLPFHHSLIAIRHSLFAVVLARQELHPTNAE
jgi:hypothetical protein